MISFVATTHLVKGTNKLIKDRQDPNYLQLEEISEECLIILSDLYRIVQLDASLSLIHSKGKMIEEHMIHSQDMTTLFKDIRVLKEVVALDKVEQSILILLINCHSVDQFISEVFQVYHL